MFASLAWFASCALKAGLLLVASWAGAALLRRGTAAARHQIWALGVAGALALPLLCWVVPSLAPPAARQLAPIASTRSFEAPAVMIGGGHAATTAPAWPMWLALGWAAGTLVVGGRLLRGHLAARRLVRAARRDVPVSWIEAHQAAATFLGLTRRVELRRSETIGSPMTIGAWRPRVLLPAAAETWSPGRLRAVLVHELGHVRRHDTLVQLAAQLGTALYWWNPLAWLAVARLRIEREHACDDLVLDTGVLPSSYAADILAVARSISQDAHAHTGAICMVDLSWTEARLRRILDAAAPRRPLRTRFRIAAAGLTLAAAVTLACTSSPPPATRAAPTATPATRPTLGAIGTLSVGAPFVRTPETGGLPFIPPQDTYPPQATAGAIDLSLVATEVQRRVGTLERCYQRRLAANPTLAGTVVIHWVIVETGQVAEACITEDTVRDPEVTECVNQLVQEAPFPAPTGGAVDVSFPFVFTAGAAIATTTPR